MMHSFKPFLFLMTKLPIVRKDSSPFKAGFAADNTEGNVARKAEYKINFEIAI